MAENRDQIRIRMMSQLSEKYDKNPGNFPWEIMQAEAIESESIRIMLEDALNQRFADTADFESLKLITAERGVEWKPATYATGTVKLTGNAGASVKIGDLVANSRVNYIIQEDKTLNINGTNNVLVKCQEAGSLGNTLENTILYFPKSLSGINAVTNEIAFTNGYDAETQQELLERYYLYVRTPGTSGNIYNYEQWAKSVAGVGDTKVKPLWNGAGTVKVVIIDSNGQPATSELISKTFDYIETQRPIGATVTVSTVTELPINIVCKIILKDNYTLDQVKTSIETNIKKYFDSLGFDQSIIYYAKVGTVIFETLGVKNIDYSTLTLNGAKNDIILTDDNTETQTAKLGTTNITV